MLFVLLLFIILFCRHCECESVALDVKDEDLMFKSF